MQNTQTRFRMHSIINVATFPDSRTKLQLQFSRRRVTLDFGILCSVNRAVGAFFLRFFSTSNGGTGDRIESVSEISKPRWLSSSGISCRRARVQRDLASVSRKDSPTAANNCAISDVIGLTHLGESI